MSRKLDINLIFLLFLAFYLTCGLIGYGNDCDTYLMIKSGQGVYLNSVYSPSRPPGYLVPELLIGGISLLGGHLLANLLSAIMGTLTLYLFFRMLNSRFDSRTALLITSVVGVNPWFVIAASSSMDYVYALFFGFSGIMLLRARHYFIAPFLFALSISSRFSSILFIFVVYGYFFFQAILVSSLSPRAMLNLSVSFIGTVLLGGLAYALSYADAGYSFNFLTYFIGDYNIWGHVYRLIYKNIFLVGLLPAVLLFLVGTYLSRKTATQILENRELLFGLLLLALYEVLFFKVPIEISYLLPVLFVIVPIWAYFTLEKRYLLFLLLALTFSYNLVNIDFLDRKYNEDTRECIGAKLGFYIRPGILVDDLRNRKISEKKYMDLYKIQHRHYNWLPKLHSSR